MKVVYGFHFFLKNISVLSSGGIFFSIFIEVNSSCIIAAKESFIA